MCPNLQQQWRQGGNDMSCCVLLPQQRLECVRVIASILHLAVAACSCEAVTMYSGLVAWLPWLKVPERQGQTRRCHSLVT